MYVCWNTAFGVGRMIFMIWFLFPEMPTGMCTNCKHASLENMLCMPVRCGPPAPRADPGAAADPRDPPAPQGMPPHASVLPTFRCSPLIFLLHTRLSFSISLSPLPCVFSISVSPPSCPMIICSKAAMEIKQKFHKSEGIPYPPLPEWPCNASCVAQLELVIPCPCGFPLPATSRLRKTTSCLVWSGWWR